MEERNFSRRSAVLGSMACLSGMAMAGPLSGRIKLAVKYDMILEPELSVREKFELLRDVGLHGTELKTDASVDHDEVLEAVQVTGIPVHGIINASDPVIVPALKMAKRFGCDSVLTWAREDPGLSYKENFEIWRGHLRDAIPLAEEFGITLCVENVRPTFIKTGQQMAEFIDSCESDRVKSYFDLGNTISWTEQSAQDWASALGHRIYKLDIKDRGHPEFGDPKIKREGVVGTNGGEVHWQKVRDVLNGIQFSGWATAEVRGGDRRRLERMAGWMRNVLDLDS